MSSDKAGRKRKRPGSDDRKGLAIGKRRRRRRRKWEKFSASNNGKSWNDSGRNNDDKFNFAKFRRRHLLAGVASIV